MAITVKFKAQKMTAPSKDTLLRKLRGGDYRDGFNSNGRFLQKRGEGRDRGVARLYSLEKHDVKIKRTKRLITRGKRKGEVEVTVEVLRPKAWVAYYYDVPVDLIDTARQDNRTFTLKVKG
jgi:hypothetical protein